MAAFTTRPRCVRTILARTANTLTLSLLLALIVFAVPAFGGTFNAYGPQTFTRANGQPIVQVVPFDVLDPSAVYEVRIANDTVSSAIVKVNGAVVFGTDAFNQMVKTLVKPVPLLAHNELSVELRGAPEERMTVTVVGYDDVAPTIRATATPLANAAGWNNGDVTVTFECQDATSGIAFCPAPVISDEEREGQVVAGTARDGAGNTATARVTISIDKSAPHLEVTSPANDATIEESEVVVTGSVDEPVSALASLMCNGIEATIDSGSFTCTVPLAEGSNMIAVVAADLAGHTAAVNVALNSQLTPRVQITEPANLTFYNISPVTVRGTVSDANATVRVNGVSAVVSQGTFTATVPLVEGNNTLSAVARSAAGKIGTGSVQVTLDTTPPRIAITSPADLAEITEASVSVTGTVNDVVVGTVNDEQAQVTVNGIQAAVSNRTFLVPTVPLGPGENTIQVVARDRVGNSNTARVTITRLAAAQSVIRVVSGNNQAGIIGGDLDQPLVVRLTDASGTPVPNKTVVFKVAAGNGALAAGGAYAPWVAVNSDANGQASASYRLGTRAGSGNNKVEATATGFAGTSVFLASAAPQGVAQVNVDAGQNQTGATGEALAFPFVVVVTDAGHNRLGSVPVTFTVIAGGGHLQNGETTLTTNTDTDGRALTILTLGDEPGFDNNLVHATVAGLTGNPAAFTATAKRPGNEADTKITGVVLNNSNEPLPGATIRLYQAYLGSNSNIPVPVATPVVTDAQGQFVMTNVPIGAFKLVADGTTIAGSRVYPTLEFDIVTVAGQENSVGLPIYLPVLDSVNRLCVSETVGGTLTLPSVPGFSFTVQPGSATFPGGARSGCITVTPVHGDKVPMVPGFGQQPRFVVTVQPVGTHFNPPAAVSFPNVDGLQPREVTEMYSYDHDLSTFVAIGTATVSADGSVLRSDPGVGIIKAGWHCGGNPNSTGTAATCPECRKCDNGNCVPKPGSCDDKDKCTEDDKCVEGACKGTPIDLGQWVMDGTIGANLNLPAGLVEKANSVIQKIPGLGGVEFKKATVGSTGQWKHCCDKDKGKIERGLREGKLNVALSVDAKGLTVWGPPTFSRTYDWVTVVAQIDFEFGLKIDGTVSFGATGGMRFDDCKEEECLFGSINGSATFTFKATAAVIGCVETWGTDKVCLGLSVTPGSIATGISANYGYNVNGCNSGWDGKFTIGKIVFKASIEPNIPGMGSFTYEKTIWPGGTF